METPFENPKEVNPFQTVIPVYLPQPPTPAIEVMVIEKVVVEKSKRHWLLEVSGACCLSYFCGPCYMFAHLCCMIFK